MARHYAVVELQLNQNGAIGTLAADLGTDEKAALSRKHMGLASIPASTLVAGAAVLVVFDDELQDSGGYISGEVLKGSGEFIAPEEQEEEE